MPIGPTFRPVRFGAAGDTAPAPKTVHFPLSLGTHLIMTEQPGEDHYKAELKGGWKPLAFHGTQTFLTAGGLGVGITTLIKQIAQETKQNQFLSTVNKVAADTAKTMRGVKTTIITTGILTTLGAIIFNAARGAAKKA